MMYQTEFTVSMTYAHILGCSEKLILAWSPITIMTLIYEAFVTRQSAMKAHRTKWGMEK